MAPNLDEYVRHVTAGAPELVDQHEPFIVLTRADDVLRVMPTPRRPITVQVAIDILNAHKYRGIYNWREYSGNIVGESLDETRLINCFMFSDFEAIAIAEKIWRDGWTGG